MDRATLKMGVCINFFILFKLLPLFDFPQNHLLEIPNSDFWVSFRLYISLWSFLQFTFLQGKREEEEEEKNGFLFRAELGFESLLYIKND